jgi:hypothetical protein
MHKSTRPPLIWEKENDLLPPPCDPLFKVIAYFRVRKSSLAKCGLRSFTMSLDIQTFARRIVQIGGEFIFPVHVEIGLSGGVFRGARPGSDAKRRELGGERAN